MLTYIIYVPGLKGLFSWFYRHHPGWYHGCAAQVLDLFSASWGYLVPLVQPLDYFLFLRYVSHGLFFCSTFCSCAFLKGSWVQIMGSFPKFCMCSIHDFGTLFLVLNSLIIASSLWMSLMVIRNLVVATLPLVSDPCLYRGFGLLGLFLNCINHRVMDLQSHWLRRGILL